MSTLPQVPSVELDKDTKKRVIAGLKLVLSRLQQQGVLESGLTYQNVLASPETLDSFFREFIAHRTECQDIVVDAAGAPVLADDQPLVCGVTLDQIAQLLVRTCARRVFEIDQIEAARTQKPKETGLMDKISDLFKGKKSEDPKTKDEETGFEPGLERKFRTILPYLSYPWQVKLLRPLRKHLSLAHITLLQGNVQDLTTPETIAAVGAIDVAALREARNTLGDDFGMVLASYPQSIKGMVVWPPEMVLYFRELLGDSVWEFFTRDEMFFNAAISLDHPVVSQLGKVLSYIDPVNLEEMARLNADRIEVLLTALRKTFGEDLMRRAFENPEFSKKNLRKIVDNVLHSKQDKDQLLATLVVTCQANVSEVREWLDRK